MMFDFALGLEPVSHFLGQCPRRVVLNIRNPAFEFMQAMNVENHQSRRNAEEDMPEICRRADRFDR